MLGFSLEPPQVKAALLGGAALAFTILGWEGCERIVHRPFVKRVQAQQLRDELAAAKITAAAATISLSARQRNDQQQETERVRTEKVIKAIPVYLPSDQHSGTGGVGAGGGEDRSAPVAGITLPVGFGRLHDYAALGVDPPVPAPSGGPDLRGSSGVGLPELAATIAGNYGVCRAAFAENDTWRQWYQEQVKAWPKSKP